MGSATQSNLIYTDKARSGFIRAALDIRKFGEEIELNQSQEQLINQAIAKFVLLPLQSSSMGKDFKSYRQIISMLKKEMFFNLSLGGVMKPYSHLGKVLNTSFMFFYFYYPFYARFTKKMYVPK